MPRHNELHRVVRTPGAILMGLGSILGTGIFVSIAIATQVAGSGVIIAIVIAAALATCNGLSSAQLAAAHPVSGGTYEYGYRFMGSHYGFSAGLMFLIAKSASAATAVLGTVGYLFYALRISDMGISAEPSVLAASGLLLLIIMNGLVSGGISRSNTANKVIVTVTLIGLVSLVIAGLAVHGIPTRPVTEALTDASLSGILQASALMFVAYTGYGRIATLGEEVAEPRRTIPKAIIVSMVVIVVLYLAVTLTALQIMGADAFGETVEGEAAPLMVVAQALDTPAIGTIVTVAAVAAMMGVLLNLILGLSRVVLSMARRGDLPAFLATVNPKTKSPVAAVWATGLVIGLLVLSSDVVFTWSFSAFTVLIYYAITNLSALAMPAEQRLYPRWIPVAGLTGCLFLTFWIESEIWLTGTALLITGILWHTFSMRLRRRDG